MKNTIEEPTNLSWRGRVDDAWQAILDDVLKRGFHGRASVELQIADGTICRVTRCVERVEK
jgi:hypothetical protein